VYFREVYVRSICYFTATPMTHLSTFCNVNRTIVVIKLIKTAVKDTKEL
jgi:hypothetical protein